MARKRRKRSKKRKGGLASAIFKSYGRVAKRTRRSAKRVFRDR